MSIALRKISKFYGTIPAVKDLTFQVARGEIVGFLGPNGAGKTTTMRILAGFIPPSSGTVEIAGIDVVKDTLKSRKILGYLPEHNPLYKSMYVREFLGFAAKLCGAGNTRKRVAEVVELTGLRDYENKKINQLSKGFRQRVGIAQAILHEPEVLVLDEPVSGLDPNQRLEIRKLIKSLGAHKTVLFSSHILQEVAAVCDRIIIINNGELVADGSLDEIRQMDGKSTGTRIVSDRTILPESLLRLSGVEKVENPAQRTYFIFHVDPAFLNKELIKLSLKDGWSIQEMQPIQISAESIFQKLTAEAK